MNLIIGDTSQLAQYFPEEYIKVSSRNIDFNYLKNNLWESVYITFAEQRIYDANIDYITPNYLYTLQIINSLLESSQKIVCYTSCELFNELSGRININTLPKFYPLNNEYCISKLLLWNKITELKKINNPYNKVIFMHPFYFNSIHRSEYFLFGKIFNSIIQRQKIEVNNLDFYRDMVHAKFVVEKSIEATQDTMIGSGKLFNIRQFIKDLYQLNGLDFDYLVQENQSGIKGKEKLIMADVPWDYSYQDLLTDTQMELEGK
jgi:GDP-D-mannose dehydratase